MRDTGMHIL